MTREGGGGGLKTSGLDQVTPELGFPLDEISSPSLLSAVSHSSGLRPLSAGFQLNSVCVVMRLYCLAGPLLPLTCKRKPQTPRPQSLKCGDHGGQCREPSQEGDPAAQSAMLAGNGSQAQTLKASGTRGCRASTWARKENKSFISCSTNFYNFFVLLP